MEKTRVNNEADNIATVVCVESRRRPTRTVNGPSLSNATGIAFAINVDNLFVDDPYHAAHHNLGVPHDLLPKN
jgi:hypothetical protein